MESGPIKAYPSQYLSLQRRRELVNSLVERLGERIETDCDAVLEVLPGDVNARKSAGETVRARAAIMATGRFGSLRVPAGVSTRFRRVEIGMRVEEPASAFVMDAEGLEQLLDPKWIRRSVDGRHEWRSFCCCRNGEVVETEFDRLLSVSGRADCPPTGRSNFGLNVRFLDPAEAEGALEQVLAAAHGPPLRVHSSDLLDSPSENAIAERFGAQVATALATGLRTLSGDFDHDLSQATLHLPALEGLGYYPAVDDTLRVTDNLWCAGDATGILRGLVPALVTGRMAALMASESLATP